MPSRTKHICLSHGRPPTYLYADLLVSLMMRIGPHSCSSSYGYVVLVLESAPLQHNTAQHSTSGHHRNRQNTQTRV